MTEEELEEFTGYVYFNLLLQRGYQVADTKPAHFIMRKRGDDLLRDKHGHPHFALIDFELISLQHRPEKGTNTFASCKKRIRKLKGYFHRMYTRIFSISTTPSLILQTTDAYGWWAISQN